MTKFSKKGNATLRRKDALKRLEAQYAKFTSSDSPKMKNGKEVRSHEAEVSRMEAEMAILKTRIA